MRELRLTSFCAFLVLAATASAQQATEAAPKAKAPVHPALTLKLDEEIPWIRDPETAVDGGSGPRRLEAKGIDRGQLVDQALEKARTTGKPVLWYIPRIYEKQKGGVQMYRAPVLDVYMRQVVFADPDVAGIVATRFVPLRLNCDEALSQRFSVRPLDVVEPVLLVLDGDGKILHQVQRIRTFSAHWTAHVLRKVLQRHQPNGATPPESVEAAQKEGRWEEALQMLEKKEERTPRDWLQIAGLQRRLRHEAEAQAALGHIEIKGGGRGPTELEALAETELGALATMQGKTGEALKHLERAFRARTNPRKAEAGYLLAANALRVGDETRALRVLGQVAQGWPDDPFGKMAQANVTLGPDERPLGATFCGFECLTWLPEAAYEGLPTDTAARPAPAAKLADLAAPALRFLLSMQRDHGGFCDSRYAYWPTPDITPNAWVAITAVAAAALLEWRELDPQRVDQALRRAEDYMFDETRIARGKNEDVYVDAYRLLYLARKSKVCEGADKQQCLDRMNAVVVDAGKRQLASGFWAHEYPNAFATGVMLWGAYVAREAGAVVPEDLVDKGTKALLSARPANGAFVYGGAAPKEREQPAGSESRRMSMTTEQIKNASGRMPACEGALLVFQRSDEAKIKAAFAAFWEYMRRFEVVRRNDFHSDGELAGFMFFHDLFQASEVNAKLGAELRAENDQKFRELLRRVPEMDGSFVDSHEIGRSYGTAMALLILKNVRE